MSLSVVSFWEDVVIKAAGMAGDRPLLVIGLSAENVRRLQEGQPVSFSTEGMPLPVLQVLVVVGDTEETITKELSQAMPVRRVVHVPVGADPSKL